MKMEKKTMIDIRDLDFKQFCQKLFDLNLLPWQKQLAQMVFERKKIAVYYGRRTPRINLRGYLRSSIPIVGEIDKPIKRKMRGKKS